MFHPQGFFSETMCPIQGCRRPYCPFFHEKVAPPQPKQQQQPLLLSPRGSVDGVGGGGAGGKGGRPVIEQEMARDTPSYSAYSAYTGYVAEGAGAGVGGGGGGPSMSSIYAPDDAAMGMYTGYIASSSSMYEPCTQTEYVAPPQPIGNYALDPSGDPSAQSEQLEQSKPPPAKRHKKSSAVYIPTPIPKQETGGREGGEGGGGEAKPFSVKREVVTPPPAPSESAEDMLASFGAVAVKKEAGEREEREEEKEREERDKAERERKERKRKEREQREREQKEKEKRERKEREKADKERAASTRQKISALPLPKVATSSPTAAPRMEKLQQYVGEVTKCDDELRRLERELRREKERRLRGSDPHVDGLFEDDDKGEEVQVIEELSFPPPSTSNGSSKDKGRRDKKAAASSSASSTPTAVKRGSSAVVADGFIPAAILAKQKRAASSTDSSPAAPVKKKQRESEKSGASTLFTLDTGADGMFSDASDGDEAAAAKEQREKEQREKEQRREKREREERERRQREKEKVEKGVSLSAEQLAAAKARVARPGAIRPVALSATKKPTMSAKDQLALRMQQVERERAESKRNAQASKEPSATVPTRRLTAEEEYQRVSRQAKVSTAGTAKAIGGGERVQRKPVDASGPAKPALRETVGCKIPQGLRQSYLDKFFQTLIPLCKNRVEAARRAEEEELAVKKRSSTKNGYSVACVNATKRLRDEGVERAGKVQAVAVSHSAVLAGRHVHDISVGVKRQERRNKSDLSESDLHAALVERYLMTDEQLASNGFPSWVDGMAGVRVEIQENERDKGKARKVWADVGDLKRICSRCAKEWRVDPKGEKIERDECIYHWGRLWQKKTKSGWESRYNCCDADNTQAGCCVAEAHVTETQPREVLDEFEETPMSRVCDPRSSRVLALDCEMVYTLRGPALARLSVVDFNDKLILDVIVKPPSKVIDANSRFSGLTMEQIDAATVTLQEARDSLFLLANQDTVLLGHSLESDLKAMRVVHRRVVDTSIVFPHKMGPPFKKALRTLAADILQRIIQDDVNGHDSKEDAATCMHLMIHKVKEDHAGSPK